MSSAVIQSRVNADIKDQAQKILKELGLSLSEYLRLSLAKLIQDKKVDFSVISSAEARSVIPPEDDLRWTPELEEVYQEAMVDFRNGDTVTLEELKAEFL